MAKADKFKHIIKSDTPVLVEFYAAWCGVCKTLNPVIDELEKELGDAIQIIKIDVDDKKGIARRQEIRALPTLAIYKNGEILWRESGLKSKEQLLEITGEFIDKSALPKEEDEEPNKKKSWLGKLFK